MKKSARNFSKDDIKKAMDTIIRRLEEEAPCAKIAEGSQHKVGEIPRWSLPPVFTCGGNCSVCIHNCYALKDYLGNKVASISKHQARNLRAVLDDLEGVEAYLIKRLSKKKPAFFRIHPSGDFAVKGLGTEYAWMWFRVALACPDTRFLAFTKCFDIVREVPFCTLPNFSLVLSEWTDVLQAPEDLKADYPTSRAVENIEDARADEVICPGGCETCGMCWALKDLKHNIAFEIH